MENKGILDAYYVTKPLLMLLEVSINALKIIIDCFFFYNDKLIK